MFERIKSWFGGKDTSEVTTPAKTAEVSSIGRNAKFALGAALGMGFFAVGSSVSADQPHPAPEPSSVAMVASTNNRGASAGAESSNVTKYKIDQVNDDFQQYRRQLNSAVVVQSAIDQLANTVELPEQTPGNVESAIEFYKTFVEKGLELSKSDSQFQSCEYFFKQLNQSMATSYSSTGFLAYVREKGMAGLQTGGMYDAEIRLFKALQAKNLIQPVQAAPSTVRVDLAQATNIPEFQSLPTGGFKIVLEKTLGEASFDSQADLGSRYATLMTEAKKVAGGPGQEEPRGASYRLLQEIEKIPLYRNGKVNSNNVVAALAASTLSSSSAPLKPDDVKGVVLDPESLGLTGPAVQKQKSVPPKTPSVSPDLLPQKTIPTPSAAPADSSGKQGYLVPSHKNSAELLRWLDGRDTQQDFDEEIEVTDDMLTYEDSDSASPVQNSKEVDLAAEAKATLARLDAKDAAQTAENLWAARKAQNNLDLRGYEESQLSSTLAKVGERVMKAAV